MSQSSTGLLVIPTLALHHEQMERAEAQICIRDLRCLSFFRRLIDTAPTCTVSSPSPIIPNLSDLNMTAVFHHNVMEMLIQNLFTVHDNLVCLAHQSTFLYIWACLATSALYSFFRRYEPSIMPVVVELAKKKKEKKLSYCKCNKQVRRNLILSTEYASRDS